MGFYNGRMPFDRRCQSTEVSSKHYLCSKIYIPRLLFDWHIFPWSPLVRPGPQSFSRKPLNISETHTHLTDNIPSKLIPKCQTILGFSAARNDGIDGSNCGDSQNSAACASPVQHHAGPITTSTPTIQFYRPDALRAAQLTVSQY